MPVFRIDRFDDPRLAAYRNISDAELLLRRNRFVAEGRLVVSRLLRAGHRVDSILVNDASFHAIQPAIESVPHDVPVYVCDTGEFAAITGFHLHRGCLALAERPAGSALADVLRESPNVLVLEGVTDADNIGSAFRNAAAFGAGVVLTNTCCDPLYRKAIRTSMGTVLRTPYARAANWPRDLAVIKEEGFTVVALTPRGNAVDLTACARPQRLALVVGSEGPGLTRAAEAMADIRARIPISPAVDSLNVATATGIALHYFAALSPKP
jgi:tRNA G18 (ribose-2'-O)-methylase SpoU